MIDADHQPTLKSEHMKLPGDVKGTSWGTNSPGTRGRQWVGPGGNGTLDLALYGVVPWLGSTLCPRMSCSFLWHLPVFTVRLSQSHVLGLCIALSCRSAISCCLHLLSRFHSPGKGVSSPVRGKAVRVCILFQGHALQTVSGSLWIRGEQCGLSNTDNRWTLWGKESVKSTQNSFVWTYEGCCGIV